MNENPNINLTLTLEEINVVMAALQELPAKICNPLSNKIREQAVAQIEAMKAADTEAAEAQKLEANETTTRS